MVILVRGCSKVLNFSYFKYPYKVIDLVATPNFSSWRLTYPGADLLSHPMVIPCNGDYESIDDFAPENTDDYTLDINEVESIDEKTTLEHFNWPKYKRGFEWPYRTATSFERTKCRFPFYLPKKEEFGDFGGKWHESCIWMSYFESSYQPVCRHDNHEGSVPSENFVKLQTKPFPLGTFRNQS